MTKEQLISKWGYTFSSGFIADINAVIDNEIAKAKEAKPQPALNPIAEAYEDGKKIRSKNWKEGWWIQKHSHDTSINKDGVIENNDWLFNIIPNSWELYTEHTEPSSQAKLDNSFDKERFERMFRAVVASGEYKGKEFDKTAESLEKLDAYYASKEGGNNG